MKLSSLREQASAATLLLPLPKTVETNWIIPSLSDWHWELSSSGNSERSSNPALNADFLLEI
jgi:hypothetical protein